MSIYERFKRTWNDGQFGFGSESYADARAAGYSNADIQAQTSGQRVGRRANDMIGAGISAERASNTAAQRAQAAADSYKSQLSNYQSQIGNFQSQIGNYQSRIQGYESQIGNYQSQIGGFQTRVNDLSNQYSQQLKATETAQSLANEFEDKFEKSSADYELAKGEADRYRNEAVGQQLRSIRAGSPTSNRQPVVGAGADLQSGSTRFAGDQKEGSLTSMIKAEGGLTDSVLARKGPVVQRIGGRPQSSGLASGSSSGSYYASRFR
jgi:hypothetical protein